MGKDIDLISDPKKSFWILCIPIIGFTLFDAVYGLIDMYWISKMSHEAYFAIGVSIPIFTLTCSFGSTIGQGTNSMMSRYIGFGNLKKSYNSFLHGIILCFSIWLIILLSISFLEVILAQINVSNSLDLILTYLNSLLAASIIFILGNFFCETFQAEGNSKIPAVLIIITGILNIILDPIFIFNFNMEIFGAALATIISSSLLVIVLIYLYLTDYTKIPLNIKYFKFTPHIVFEITKVSVPNFIDSAIWCILALFVNEILISDLGQFGIILYSASGKIKDFLVAPIKSMGKAIMSVTGHLYGARKIDDIKEMYLYVLKYSTAISMLISVIFFLIRDNIYQLFSVSSIGTYYIALLGIPIIVCMPFSIIASKMLDGFGKSYYSLLFTIFKIIFEISIILALKKQFPLGSSVLVGMTITEIVFAIVYYIFLRWLMKRFDEHKDSLSVV